MFAPAGHFSYRQMEIMREVLGKVGTWDLVRLHCGEQLKGDYQGCQYIALNRQETDTLAFSRAKTLSSNSLWALLGHAPQVSPQHWLWWLALISRNTPSQTYCIAPAGGSNTIQLMTRSASKVKKNAAKMHWFGWNLQNLTVILQLFQLFESRLGKI